MTRVLVSLLFVSAMSSAMADTEILLWNDDMPGNATSEPEQLLPDRGNNVIHLTNVSKPTLQLFLLKKSEVPTPFVVVLPGGGYNILSMNKEGTEIAEWLNSIGVSAAVLKYRVPDNRDGALEDARKSIRLARTKSGEWNIHPERIGMLGFSAGGHLAAATSNSVDRPDFSVLVYPAYLFAQGGIELASDIKVDTETPPAFVVQTKDDKKYYRSTLAYTAALDAVGVDVESHLFAKGGHGYGIRDGGHPVSQWPDLCAAWMREMGFLIETEDH